jgi:hypothetical protein
MSKPLPIKDHAFAQGCNAQTFSQTLHCQNVLLTNDELICKSSRVIWLGDLNYRVALSYDETKTLMGENDWDTLLEKDQV